MTTSIKTQDKAVRFNRLNAEAQHNAYQSWLANSLSKPSSSNSFFLDMLLSELKDKGITTKATKVEGISAKQIEVVEMKSDSSDYDLKDLKGLRAIKVILNLYYGMTQRPFIYGYLKEEYMTIFTKSDISCDFYADYFRKKRYSKFWRGNLRLEIDRIANAFLRGLYLSIVLNKSKSVKDHLESALQLASEQVVERDEYMTSEQFFIDCVSDKYLFNADGTIALQPTHC